MAARAAAARRIRRRNRVRIAPRRELARSKRWECDKTLISALFALFGKQMQIPSRLFFTLVIALIIRCIAYGHYPKSWLAAGSIISRIHEQVMWVSTVWIVALSILIMFSDSVSQEDQSKLELAILITSTIVSICLFMAHQLYLLFNCLASFVDIIWKRITGGSSNSGAATVPVAAARPNV